MKIFARSDVGRLRRANEDIIRIEDWNSREAPDGRTSSGIESKWILLADGMGGHAHGEVASELAVELLSETLLGVTNAQHLQEAVAAVHLRLHELMSLHGDLEGMGTTIVGIIRTVDRLVGFNVGDSRLYRWRPGSLDLLSHDDGRGHVLTQCLGGFERSPPLVHTVEWQPHPGERLLLCSDGLTDLIDDRAIDDMLSGVSGDPADALVERALAAGGHDNVSVVVAEP